MTLRFPVAPMKATMGSTGAVPDGDDWAFEIKWDGLRALAFVEEGGTLLALGRSSGWIAEQLGLPIVDRLRGQASAVFFAPGAQVALRVDTRYASAFDLALWVQLLEVDTPQDGRPGERELTIDELFHPATLELAEERA